MKRMMMVLALVALSGLASVRAFSFGGFEISFGAFYSSLDPHGEWITVDAGLYAWRPMHVETGWRPYQFGRWVWTDDGWYWDTEEPWGWATYHYGRWYFDDYYGWLWIPGYDWAPAWVEWRYGGDYVGWAPLGPYAVYNGSYGIHYSRHWVTPYHYWSFVNCRHMMHHNINRYVYRSEDNTRFIGRTRTGGSVRPGNGRALSRGPEPEYIERRGDVRIPRTTLVDVEDRDRVRGMRGEGNDRVGVYRPRIEDRRGGERVERPGSVRENERMPSLDTRRLDVRRREEARADGRSIDRLEQRNTEPRSMNPEGRPADRNGRWFEVAPRERRDETRQDVDRRSVDRSQSDRRVERGADVSRTDRSNTDRRVWRNQDADRSERPRNEGRVSRAPEVNRSERPSADRPVMRDGGSSNRGERSSGSSGGRSEGRGRR